MGKWLAKLRKAKDAALNDRLQVNGFMVDQNCMQSQQLLMSWIARDYGEFHFIVEYFRAYVLARYRALS